MPLLPCCSAQEAAMTRGQSRRTSLKGTVLPGNMSTWGTCVMVNIQMDQRSRLCFVLVIKPPASTHPSSVGTGTHSSSIRSEVMTSSCFVTFLFATSVTWWLRTRRLSLVWSKNCDYLTLNHLPHQLRHNVIGFVCVCFCSVTSSEKVDKAHRYADFTLLSVPYPGNTSSGPNPGADPDPHSLVLVLNSCFCVWDWSTKGRDHNTSDHGVYVFFQDVSFLKSTKTETTQQKVWSSTGTR